MKTSTTVAQDLGTWQERTGAGCASLPALANKIILAHVLQGCVPEYSRCSIPNSFPVWKARRKSALSLWIRMSWTRDASAATRRTKSITEGNVNFDILLSARTPQRQRVPADFHQRGKSERLEPRLSPVETGLLLLWAAPFPAERNRLPEFRLPETPKGLFPLDLSGPSKVQTEHPDIVSHNGRKFGGQRQI